MIYLRQSTASQEIPIGYFVDSTDGNTEETALTIANTDIKLWKNGAITLANKNSGGATHISNGIYYATLDATDTNTLGSMVIFVHVAGALTNKVNCVVLPTNIYDSWIAGTDYQSVDVANIDNATGAIANLEAMFDGTGYAGGTIKLGVDAVALSGDTVAADNAELFFDGTGYAAANSTIGTVTNLTNAPYTVAQIADGVWDEATVGHTTAGTFGEQVKTDIDAILDDTGTTGVVADVTKINGSATPATNLAAMFDGVTGYAGAGTKLQVNAVEINTNTTAATNLRAAYDGTGYVGGTIKQAVDAVAISGDTVAADNAELFFDGTGYNASASTVGTVTNLTNPNPTAAAIADAIWDEATTGHTTVGTFGEQLKTDVDAILDDTGTSGVVVGTITDKAGYSLSAAGIDAIWDELTSGHVTAGSFAERIATDIPAILTDTGTAGVIVATNNDKTGYGLSAAAVDAIFDEPTVGHTTAGTFGEQLKTDIDAILDDTGTAGVIVATNNDKTGYTLTAAGIDAIWDELTSGHVTVGSFAERIATDIPAILTDTGTAGVIVATNNDKTDYTLTAAGVDAILDEVVEGSLTLRQIVRIFLSVLAGKSSGGGTGSVTFRDAADVKARVSATLDASGNRTAMTLDGS